MSKFEVKIKKATVGYGEVGVGGKLGFDDGAVVGAPKADFIISAHSDSDVEIELDRPCEIVGFVSRDAMRNCCVQTFYIDEEEVGSIIPNGITAKKIVDKGTRRLRVKSNGRNYFAHSCWALTPVEADFDAPAEKDAEKETNAASVVERSEETSKETPKEETAETTETTEENPSAVEPVVEPVVKTKKRKATEKKRSLSAEKETGQNVD